MLTTQRLELKPMRNEDAYHLFMLNSDPEVVRYTGDETSKNLADAQRILSDIVFPQFQKYKMGRFSVFLKDGTYIGWCGLKNYPEIHEVDLGYRFMKKFWGQGYATEAALACLKYGFETLNLTRIVARSVPQNVASIKVMQKMGMTYRGMQQDQHFPHGYVLYDITAEEFKKWQN